MNLLVSPLPMFPDYLVASGWLEHGPFVMALVATARPRIIVELGTHNGFSYFCMCQAVSEYSLETKCYAIDTWEGDEHAGYYGEEVLHGVSAYNERYKDFSTLLRMKFSDALSQFEDGSIDLLHVDGRHFYKDVKEDFESWMPKLSKSAIVIFHDIDVTENGFGVYKYWAEIDQLAPSISFHYCNGLGVLFLGSERNKELTEFISEVSSPNGELVASRKFGKLGANVSRLCSLAETDGNFTNVEEICSKVVQELATKDNLIQSLSDQLEEAQYNHVAAQDANEHISGELKSVTGQIEYLSTNLMWARRRPHKEIKNLLIYRALRILSRIAPPFSDRTKSRIARSAAKRDPRRSLINQNKGNYFVEFDWKNDYRQQSQVRLSRFLKTERRLNIPFSSSPSVTILLVLWNQASLTLDCLTSLASEIDVPFELIIVDNASTDETADVLGQIRGAKIIRNDRNIGFLLAVNQGLQEARGDHVLLLNNDAILRKGTLYAAVRAIESADDIGAVGARIVLPDGNLQEAGSIIFRDGSCFGYGRGEPPEAFDYMFQRDVDYCSGAFLLIKRSIFEALGGFDTAYAPAYYEETDLCMRIRELGLRVVYEPLAVIDHLEFGSSEKSEDAINLQKRNQQIFREKHSAALLEQMSPDPDQFLEARSRDKKRRVLFIDDRVPLNGLGSGFPRTLDILKALVQEGYFVTFYPSTTPDEDWASTIETVPVGVEVAMGYGGTNLDKFLMKRRGYYDTVLVSRPHNMKFLLEVKDKFPNLVSPLNIIYDAEALFAGRDRVKAQVLGDTKLLSDANKKIGQELEMAKKASRVVAVSAKEALEFKGAGCLDVRVLGHSLTPFPSQDTFVDRNGVLFVGALDVDDSPNVDSLVWYITEVMPLLEPRLKLRVVGSHKSERMVKYANDDVNLRGMVPDLSSQFSDARVFVAPTRFAAGIPHKVHQAAAYGVPVVATRLLADQLGWTDGKELLVADTPEKFADAVTRLHEDKDLWESLREGAFARILQECSPANFSKKVGEVVG